MKRDSTIDTASSTSDEDQTKPKIAIEKTKIQNNYKSFFRRFCKLPNCKSKKEDSLFRDVEATDDKLIESGQTIQNKCFKRISCMERAIPVSYDSIKKSILSEMKKCGRVKVLYDIVSGKLTKLNLKEDVRHLSTDIINTVMLWCVLCKNLELLDELVKLGANIRYSEHIHGLAALHIAAFIGSTKITKYLINQNINVNVINKWYNPLHCAAFAKKVETARILLDNGARINSMANGPGYETALYIAVKADAIDCVKLFIERGAQIYQEGKPGDMSPFFLAAELGRCECLKMILETKTINCNELWKTENGNTALHIAAEEGHTDCIEILLEHGANPNLTNHREESALHLAVKANSYTSVVALIKKGNADPNLEDCGKRTPLHTAVEILADSRKDIVKVLLSNGANVNAQDQHGFTALHMAALNESSHCANILIKNEADCSMKTKSGVTAFSLIAKKTPSVVEAIYDRFTDYITLIYQSDSLSDVEVMFDFKNGLPHSKEYSILNSFIDGGHKEILMHPFIMAFLYVTWGRTRRCFFGMISHSLIFSILMLFYVLTALAYDCDKKIKDPAYTNSTIHCNNTSYLNEYLRKSPVTLKIQWYILLYFTISLAYRKIYGIHGYPSLKHYCQNYCNILEWNNILYVFLISFVYTQSVESWQVCVGAFAVLSAWTNLMFSIGQLPSFGPYFEMFQKVQNEFQKLLVVFFPLILAYTVSFCILFPNSSAFPNPLTGFTSALVIMTGDMNYDLLLTYSETEDSFNFAKISVQIIYTLFLIQITIILMNLLVGIVVNDIESLQKNADLSRLERQTKMCSYVEMSHYQRSVLAQSIMILLRVVPKPYVPVLKVKSPNQKENKTLKEIVQAAYNLAKKKEIEKKNIFKKNRDESRSWRRLTIGSLKENKSHDFKWTASLSQVMCNLSDQSNQIRNFRDEIAELKDVIKTGFPVSPIREEVSFHIDDEKLKPKRIL